MDMRIHGVSPRTQLANTNKARRTKRGSSQVEQTGNGRGRWKMEERRNWKLEEDAIRNNQGNNLNIKAKYLINYQVVINDKRIRESCQNLGHQLLVEDNIKKPPLKKSRLMQVLSLMSN
ncbi:hypothetical protein SUGI_0098350 [Cryptomeria japonica]|nr:hypothetical protein SUGI_0098350 [Cryptomeria japonica]